MGIITFWMIQGLLETIAGALQSVTIETVTSDQPCGGGLRPVTKPEKRNFFLTQSPHFSRSFLLSTTEQSQVPPTLSIFF